MEYILLPYMRQDTLLFLFKDDEILLAMKKRGFGAGKYNGVGGKVQEGESVEFAAVREAQEEILVTVQESDLQKVAELQFSFDQKPGWNIFCHVFTTRVWQGEPTESDEMAPQWFALDAIPFEKMWVDDKHWLPHVLAGKTLQGEFYFNSDGSSILKQQIKII